MSTFISCALIARKICTLELKRCLPEAFELEDVSPKWVPPQKAKHNKYSLVPPSPQSPRISPINSHTDCPCSIIPWTSDRKLSGPSMGLPPKCKDRVLGRRTFKISAARVIG